MGSLADDMKRIVREHAFCILILQLASSPLIQGGSRMRKSARTDLCGGRSVMIVPTASSGLLD